MPLSKAQYSSLLTWALIFGDIEIIDDELKKGSGHRDKRIRTGLGPHDQEVLQEAINSGVDFACLSPEVVDQIGSYLPESMKMTLRTVNRQCSVVRLDATVNNQYPIRRALVKYAQADWGVMLENALDVLIWLMKKPGVTPFVREHQEMNMFIKSHRMKKGCG